MRLGKESPGLIREGGDPRWLRLCFCDCFIPSELGCVLRPHGPWIRSRSVEEVRTAARNHQKQLQCNRQGRETEGVTLRARGSACVFLD